MKDTFQPRYRVIHPHINEVEQGAASKTVSCSFDKDAVWNKVRDRKPAVLDMNAWIDMADDKNDLATRVKGSLRNFVSAGRIFCPLSFGLIAELYKQTEDSRLRVGTLMEELSLNVSYASQEEIFAWEVEKHVRRLVDAGPIDLSTSELYVPVLAYLSSRFRLEFPEVFPAEHIEDFTSTFKERAMSLSFTELLKMRAANTADDIHDYANSFPPPKFSEGAKRIWEAVRGDRKKIKRLESEAVFRLHVEPAISSLPLPLQVRFAEYALTARKDEYGGFLGELFKFLPALSNEVEVMAAVTQNPTRRDKCNDFFDFEVIPVPLAYASVFVARDKGIKDILRNRTDILKHNSCRYCFDLAELEAWLASEAAA